MTDAQTILKMIEAVDPADTAKLDEIDARVWCLLENKKFVMMRLTNRGHFFFEEPFAGLIAQGEHSTDFVEKYTRSRDALKAIRPDGWGFNNYYHYKHGIDSQLHSCSAGHWKVNQWENTIFAEALPTEELAELHAIIQAIDYERSQK